MARGFMMPKVLSILFLTSLLSVPLFGQSVRDRTRPSNNGGPKRSGAALSDEQAQDVTLTLNAVTVRPIQTWVRTAGRIDKNAKVLTATVPAPDATFVQVGQRVRAFSPESKSSMFQA